MQVSDTFFVGRIGWAEQLLFSIQTIERANREFKHPNLIISEKIEQSITWDFADEVVNIKADFYCIPQLLVNQPTIAKRVRAYTPTRAIDVGIDRDLSTQFTGMPIQTDLMLGKHLDTLEERTAYLLSARVVHGWLVKEWNDFADLQENLWLKIYRDEGLIQSSYDQLHPGALYNFTFTAGLAGTGLFSGVWEKYGYIRNVGRAGYEAAITKWLLDSGTTARTGGQAIDNDSYILWLAAQLSEVSADLSKVATRSIDPRYVYRFNPIIPLAPIIETSGDGVSGVPDSGAADPASNDTPGQNLLEELANREQPLTAELGAGLSTAPINTLPEC
jgi:hypothetical protein